MGEIDLLISQARTEAGRHESRREAAAGKLASLSEHADPRDRVEQSTALIALTQRAALMETQVEVLDGKRRALARYRDSLADYIQTLEGVDPAASGGRGADTDAPMDPATARLLMGAQEDLRREMGRCMMVGPEPDQHRPAGADRWSASSDDPSGRRRSRQLVGMVQQTLDATEAFIFDGRWCSTTSVSCRRYGARPRRAAAPTCQSNSSRWARTGACRWTSSGLFRMLDEGLAAYLAAGDSVTLRLDWSDRLVAEHGCHSGDARARTAPRSRSNEETRHTMPPALAALVEKNGGRPSRPPRSAVRASVVMHAPADMARDPGQSGVGRGASRLALPDGGRLYLVADLPMMDGAGAGTT